MLTKLEKFYQRVRLMKLMLSYKQAEIWTRRGYEAWFSSLAAGDRMIWKRRFGDLEFRQ